ncbi:hypothetical protein RJT34_02179 [Clitoria ternatea]|uniref:Uncharacterized protein n=1 Tax=Clitoria ternatea TaxID=43366 RepID=A0AAN9Q082_CLITE
MMIERMGRKHEKDGEECGSTGGCGHRLLDSGGEGDFEVVMVANSVLDFCETNKKGLPKRSVSVLRAWLFEHFLSPYPKDIFIPLWIIMTPKSKFMNVADSGFRGKACSWTNWKQDIETNVKSIRKNGKLATKSVSGVMENWLQTPWHHSLASRGSSTPLRLSSDDVDPEVMDLRSYAGYVKSYDKETKIYHVKYGDDEEENLILSNENVKFHVSF